MESQRKILPGGDVTVARPAESTYPPGTKVTRAPTIIRRVVAGPAGGYRQSHPTATTGPNALPVGITAEQSQKMAGKIEGSYQPALPTVKESNSYTVDSQPPDSYHSQKLSSGFQNWQPNIGRQSQNLVSPGSGTDYRNINDQFSQPHNSAKLDTPVSAKNEDNQSRRLSHGARYSMGNNDGHRQASVTQGKKTVIYYRQDPNTGQRVEISESDATRNFKHDSRPSWGKFEVANPKNEEKKS